MNIRAVYIGPMVFFSGAFHAHFTTATEAAARIGNGIEIKIDDRPALAERLRRLRAMEAMNERG
jgi:hypothetical protein